MRRARSGLAALALALATSTVAHGQASPSPADGSPDEIGTAFSASGGIDGNLALGIIDRYLIGARGVAQLTTPTWGFYVEPRWLRAEVSDNKTDSEYYLRVVGYVLPRNLRRLFQAKREGY